MSLVVVAIADTQPPDELPMMAIRSGSMRCSRACERSQRIAARMSNSWPGNFT
jgi:hypothetical protein